MYQCPPFQELWMIIHALAFAPECRCSNWPGNWITNPMRRQFFSSKRKLMSSGLWSHLSGKNFFHKLSAELKRLQWHIITLFYLVLLAEDALKKIETYTKLNKKNGFFYWEMLIVIPTELFIRHSLQSLGGIVCRANFYKCGDGLSQPHYLSWNNIESGTPNFHLPQFFGEIFFE